MSHIENLALNSTNLNCLPDFYVRYVDDTLCTFDTKEKMTSFVDLLKRNSVLNFTTETPSSDTFSFLDICMKVVNGKIVTGIHVKKTDGGDYFDFNSYVPEKYKSSVKILVYRAHKIASTWDLFHKEIERITQNLVNNNFPQIFVEKTIGKTLEKIKKKEPSSDKTASIDFYHI